MSTNRQHDRMTGYTKLFASILDSTIWREEDKTRIVWITLLAMANQWGDVEASIPGLADRARVTIPEAEAALVILSAPDEYSRTKDFEGRRVQVIDGGWRILNHGKYREKMSQDHRREYLAQKQRERRARLKGTETVNATSTNVNTVNSTSRLSTQAEAHTDTEAQAVKTVSPPKPPRTFVYPPDFEAFWEAYPNKTGKGDASRAFGRVLSRPPIADLLAAISTQKRSEQWQKEGGRFIPHPTTWLNGRRWEDQLLDLPPTSYGSQKTQPSTPGNLNAGRYSRRPGA